MAKVNLVEEIEKLRLSAIESLDRELQVDRAKISRSNDEFTMRYIINGSKCELFAVSDIENLVRKKFSDFSRVSVTQNIYNGEMSFLILIYVKPLKKYFD